jgi:RNA polymerase sigma-70 factor (ECF subfamily)
MSSSSEFKTSLVAAIPTLRAFAISLTGRVDRADDLVQETLMKAWAAQASFTPGTNLRAWLYTILRNEFYSYHRKRKREVEDAEGKIAASVGTHPEQESHMDFGDMRAALLRLPEDQREALLLVTASDLSYEEASQVCGVAIGTIKSRVNRARTRLALLLDAQDSSDFAPAPTYQAALATSKP